MGGICPCSRGSTVSKAKQDTEPQDGASEKMLADDASSLRVGKQPPYGTMKEGTVQYQKLSTNDKHKPVKQRPHEQIESKQSKSKSKSKKDYQRISGVDDTGIEHNNTVTSPLKSGDDANNADNDDDSDDDDENNNNNLSLKSQSNSKSREPSFLSASSETLVVTRGGFDTTNGEYRWFLHSKNWCYFTESGTNYIIQGEVSVNEVYKQLRNLRGSNANFEWGQDVNQCWVISDMEMNHFYYAAPMQFSDKIPSNFGWISVHGSEPGPTITQNKLHDSQFPESEEDSVSFGNNSASSMSSLTGRHPSSRMNNIEPLLEEEDANIEQETPRNDNDNENNNNNNNNDDDDDDDDESEVSQMSE